MTLSYNLRTLDELDGISRSSPSAPRWKAHKWPNATGLDKGKLGDDPQLAAYRVDGNQKNDGWSALDDLASVISGFDRKDAAVGWNTIQAADLVKIMTVFRALGAEDRLEICLSPEYQGIMDQYPAKADEQVRKSVELAQQV
jgi:hypothetical protein